jgi:CRISPR-associated endonuclease Cas1
MQDQKFTLPFPPLQVRAGILVADGFGISARVLYGKLHVEDGIGSHRRSIVVDRAGSGLERLVLLGKSGTLTLESLAWLRAIGAALVHLSADGHVLTHTVPFGYWGHPIRRAQALAIATGLDVEIARDLIASKLDGQRANLVRLRASDLTGFDRLREALTRTTAIDDVRLCEAKAAAIYWNAWSSVPIHLRGRDLVRVPAKWTRYESRASILTGAPRAATNPVNALLNFVYSLLESESRLALLAAGLDPTLGVLHADQRNRDSFALDAMEPVRPDVDSFVLDLLEERTLTSRDFVELPNGVCRVRAPLSHDLALTIPRWRQRIGPVVAGLAHRFRSALLHREDRLETPRALAISKKHLSEISETSREGLVKPEIPRTKTSLGHHARVRRLTPAQSPLDATPRKASPPRPYASRAWTTARPESLALMPAACATCGAPVLKRRRRYCEVCLPKARRERGLRAIAIARKALAAQASSGKDPRASVKAGRKRGEANVEQHRRNREWARGAESAERDRAWFLRKIVPMLNALTLAEIAEATGLSLAACSRVRSGARVPHPRHWEAFCALVELS